MGTIYGKMKNSKNLLKLIEYETVIYCGSKKPPPPYKQIKVHLVYNFNPNLMRKDFVSDGHLAVTPLHSVYSNVVSLQGLKHVYSFPKSKT